MDRTSRAIIPLGLALLLGQSAAPAASGDVVARLDDWTLTVSQFEEQATELRRTGYKHLQSLDQEAKLELLDGIIARHLLIEEGLRRGLDQDSSVAAHLNGIRRRAVVSELYERRAVQEEYTFTEEELRAFFTERQFDVEVLTRHILCSSEEEGREALAALREGVSFEILVRTYSPDNIQRRFGPGGWLGWFKIGDAFEELRDPMATMPEGSVYPEPVKSVLGWHVFFLKERRSVDFAASREWLEKHILVQARADDMARYVVGLREQYGLTPHFDGLAALGEIPAGQTDWYGGDELLFSWNGGTLTVADYLEELRAGGARHPASLDSAGRYKVADNLAGRHIMMVEAARHGIDSSLAVTREVAGPRNEIVVQALYQMETKSRASDGVSDEDARDFYDKNLDLFTRTDGVVSDFGLVRGSIRSLMRRQAATAAMDSLLSELRSATADRMEVYPDALAGAFAPPP